MQGNEKKVSRLIFASENRVVDLHGTILCHELDETELIDVFQTLRKSMPKSYKRVRRFKNNGSQAHFILCRMCVCHMFINVRTYLLTNAVTPFLNRHISHQMKTWWLKGGEFPDVLQFTRSIQPCIPPGSLNRVPASAGVKAGMSPLPGGRYNTV